MENNFIECLYLSELLENWMKVYLWRCKGNTYLHSAVSSCRDIEAVPGWRGKPCNFWLFRDYALVYPTCTALYNTDCGCL